VDTNSSAKLLDLIQRNRRGEKRGMYSICSGHPAVIDAGLRQTLGDDSLALIESTSSQVNQFGGYTGLTPAQFAASVEQAAKRIGLPKAQVLVGGDHLGPYPWRNQPAATALAQARELVRSCVLAGYKKIHLDASMACADDPSPLAEDVVADRAAALCRSAEDAFAEMPGGNSPPLYIIGTEVPIPGGETQEGEPPAVTSTEQLSNTLEVFRVAFDHHKVSSAWERVVGIVVQPGVEFGEKVIFEYDRKKAEKLSASLPQTPALVYEAHSTDYQPCAALTQMVQDHFAILKVGPALTFAFREAVFALSAIEREYLAGNRTLQLSQVRAALEAAMLRNPSHWRPYYHGSEEEQKLARSFSYSDRIRYYWPDPEVQRQLNQLIKNLADSPPPPTLISQYLPLEYQAISAGMISSEPTAVIEHHIRLVLHGYASACGTLKQ
jgi:D-tagatose-1,6-bisphosphate aldolase subunit GatZ/KbaZ